MPLSLRRALLPSLSLRLALPLRLQTCLYPSLTLTLELLLELDLLLLTVLLYGKGESYLEYLTVFSIQLLKLFFRVK